MFHYRDRGPCDVVLRAGGGIPHPCTCSRFVSLGALIGVRVLVILFFVAVLGSLPAVVDLVTGAPR
jgi:hypothetical protein